MNDTTRRVLFVSYCFPPVGGVAVQRVTKFVKYLPEFSWECSVLTVSDPSEALMDESLLNEIPPQTIVRRAKTYEPGQSVKAAIGAGGSASGRFAGLASAAKSVVRRIATTILQPDAQILWAPRALQEGKRLLREVPHDAIVATGPPFSALLVGAKLSSDAKLPLLLDYRDEWGISNRYWENRQPGKWSTALQMRMQRWAVRRASRLIATTPSSARALTDVAREAGSAVQGTCIYNGFDGDDFPYPPPPQRRDDFGNGTDRCRLTLVGSLWNLVPVRPFVEGVLSFAADHPQLASELELLFVGHRTAEQEAVIDRLAHTSTRVVRLPFVPHRRALELMRDADALLLLLADLPHADRVVSARTFEYMASRRPMFVVSPQGDLWDLVADLPGTQTCLPGDTQLIANALKVLVERHRAGVRYAPAEWDIDRFERRHLTGELVRLLNATCRTIHDRTARPEPAVAVPDGR